jgi:hypothetical protein
MLSVSAASVAAVVRGASKALLRAATAAALLFVSRPAPPIVDAVDFCLHQVDAADFSLHAVDAVDYTLTVSDSVTF